MASSLFSGLTSCIVLTVFLCVAVNLACGNVETKPVMFIFGDSTADVGTNNFLRTQAKANVPYYGIDFANSEPTGRFSNGLNTIDHIARQFGYLESPPPYFSLRFDPHFTFNKDVLGGANFASGGSGILRDTGKKHWGAVLPLEVQVEQFAMVQDSLVETLGATQAAAFVSKALFIISVGGNDLLEFSNNKTAIRLGQQKQYLSAVQSNYYTQILNLYRLGARRFGIISVPAIGCCPAVRVTNHGKCGDELNQFAIALNSATLKLMKKLSYELKDLKYSFGNSFAMTSAVLRSPAGFGIKETEKACCGVGKLNGEGPCLKSIGANLCEKRSDFLFWDWFHPTDKASFLAAVSLCNGPPALVTPINFRQLAQI